MSSTFGASSSAPAGGIGRNARTETHPCPRSRTLVGARRTITRLRFCNRRSSQLTTAPHCNRKVRMRYPIHRTTRDDTSWARGLPLSHASWLSEIDPSAKAHTRIAVAWTRNHRDTGLGQFRTVRYKPSVCSSWPTGNNRACGPDRHPGPSVGVSV